MKDIGLTELAYIPQLFYLEQNGILVLLVAKVADGLLMTEENQYFKSFVSEFNSKLKFGRVKSGPCHLRFFSLYIYQINIIQSKSTVMRNGTHRIPTLCQEKDANVFANF